MGAIDDYINGLEGQDNIDPQKIVSDLLGLHNSEIESREAKIAELNASVAQRESAIAAKDADIQKWKAQNFDLAMQVSGDNASQQKPRDENEKPTGDRIRVSDLFTPTVRGRHFRDGN